MMFWIGSWTIDTTSWRYLKAAAPYYIMLQAREYKANPMMYQGKPNVTQSFYSGCNRDIYFYFETRYHAQFLNIKPQEIKRNLHKQ
jgi:hypothetical protein